MISVLSAKTLPIAHRGASAYTPENTMSAIQSAIELNIKYIEIDVHMTKDGRIVAIHDSTIDRTSNSSGNINDYTLDQLKTFDFGSWYNKDFIGEKIPSLDEVLEIIEEDTVLIIELKYGSSKYKNIENKIIEIITSMGKEKNIILKSFDSEILEEFATISPDIKRLYCTFGENTWFTVDNFFRMHGILEKVNFQYLQVHKYFLSKSLIRRAHNKNIKIIVWDVHDKKDMKKFIDYNVDFIESNNPDRVLEVQR